MNDFPALRTLHVRHSGLTEAICRAYAEAELVLSWDVPDERVRRAWANHIDAVEMGAYALAIGTVEVIHGWFAIARAETLTGADYYVGPPGVDLETAYRLEVSGTNSRDDTELGERLSRKLRQIRAGHSPLPGLACVVGFAMGLILVSDLERPQ